MLTTIISYTNDININDIINTQTGIKSLNDKDFILLNNNKELARFTIAEGRITCSYSGSLKLSQYEAIHDAILSIARQSNGMIDDSKSMLGYLEKGEPAFISNNWDKWTEMLNNAKYKTLEGQMVRVIDEKGAELGTGMLVDYTFSTSTLQTSIITECTLITLLGERKYSGNVLVVEPTGQW